MFLAPGHGIHWVLCYGYLSDPVRAGVRVRNRCEPVHSPKPRFGDLSLHFVACRFSSRLGFSILASKVNQITATLPSKYRPRSKETAMFTSVKTTVATLAAIAAAHVALMGSAAVSLQAVADHSMITVVKAEPIIVRASSIQIVKADRIEVRATRTAAKQVFRA